MRLTFLPLLLLAAACDPPAEPDDRVGQSGHAPSAAPVEQDCRALEELMGEYRVAAIDGQPLDASFGVAVSIDPEAITYDPRCAGFVWTYQYREGRLETRRPSGPAQAVCEIAVAPELTQLASALDSAERAERTPENGIRLSGGGRSVTLFSQ